MSEEPRIYVRGLGAVSPAGWGVQPLLEALAGAEPIATRQIARPGWSRSLRVRQVPAATPRPAFMSHARLRRTSPIAHYAVGAALEALGPDAAACASGELRLGVVFCAMSGCVNYSRRFYSEVLNDPLTASPLVFPETVYNAPASHLAAVLGVGGMNYTLVGDPGTFIQGIALAADWLAGGRVDRCLVVAAEEIDWLTADAMRLFARETIVSDGAGALYLGCQPLVETPVQLRAITNSHLFGTNSRTEAARLARAEIRSNGGLLCDGLLGSIRADRDEQDAWQDWTGVRLSPKKILGEGLTAAAAWQCVAAVDALRKNQYDTATISVVGCNQQAIAAQFVTASKNPGPDPSGEAGSA